MSPHPIPRPYAAIMMLLFLVITGLAAIIASSKTKLPHGADVIKGEYALKFEKAFDKNFPVRDAIIGSWGAVNYGLFNTGSKGVVIGKDGWLFTDEEYTTLDDKAWEHYKNNITFIDEAYTKLRQYDVQPFIVLLPAKARFYEEKLAYPMPESRIGLYEKAITEIRARNIPVLDAYSEMTAHKLGGEPLFMKTDTHWTPTGAYVVAQAIGNALKENKVLTRSKYILTWNSQVKEHEGDLASFIPTGFAEDSIGIPDEPYKDFMVEKQQDGEASGSLFADEAVEIVLVGTSYSKVEAWNFEGALRYSLQADVLNMADEGAGPVLPMRKLLHDIGEGIITPPKLVIWEIPERFLSVKYDTSLTYDPNQAKEAK